MPPPSELLVHAPYGVLFAVTSMEPLLLLLLLPARYALSQNVTGPSVNVFAGNPRFSNLFNIPLLGSSGNVAHSCNRGLFVDNGPDALGNVQELTNYDPKVGLQPDLYLLRACACTCSCLCVWRQANVALWLLRPVWLLACAHVSMGVGVGVAACLHALRECLQVMCLLSPA